MSSLKTLFEENLFLPSEIVQGLLEKWKIKRRLRRNEFVMEKGNVENYLYFVEKGTQRIFYTHKDAEICVGFGYENTLLCSYPSLIKKEPSEYYIEVLTETELTGIHREDLYRLIETYPAFERCWRLLTEEALLGKIEREVEMLTFDPEERVERLFTRSPHLFQLIPLKYIASYLRMQPETLSRIRKRKS